jgi:hypothetical protein
MTAGWRWRLIGILRLAARPLERGLRCSAQHDRSLVVFGNGQGNSLLDIPRPIHTNIRGLTRLFSAIFPQFQMASRV